MFNEFKDDIDAVLKTLTFRERQVFQRLRGIYGPVQTLETVAEDFKITEKRVQQIDHKAVMKLQHPTRMKILTRIPFETVLKFFGAE